MKRKIALILAIITIVTLMPVQAMAAKGDKLIALTFDDGPAGSNTTELLDGLRARGAKCTFFLCGYKVERYPEMVKQMWLDGHQIACHTYDHPYLTKLNDSEIKDQLSKTDKLLDKAIGLDLDYMLRPPYGDYNDRVLKAANVPCFYWSMDTGDWKSGATADSVYREFIKQAKDGSIALLHDPHMTSVQAALRAVDTLQAQGYEFVTLSEMFYRRGITLQNGQIYFSAYPGSYGTDDGIAEPVITSEIFADGMQVTISGDSRCKVYYTLNGETPDPSNSTLYTGPFTVPHTTTVKAVSVGWWNGLKSDVTTENVVYTPAAMPAISLEDGLVSMECATENSVIYYSCDGSVPDKESEIYSEPFEAVPGTSYRAVAYAPGHDSSPVSLLTYSGRGNVFTDVSISSWYYDAADRTVAEGIFKGVSETEFAPKLNCSRAMLATVLYRMAGEPEVSGLTEPFSDVPEDAWFTDAVIWAYQNEVVKGYGNDTFKPNANITREEMCAMLTRFLRAQGKDLEGLNTGAVESFADSASIAKFFLQDVDMISSLGIVQGDEHQRMNPKLNASRAEVATMLIRMLDAMDAIPDLEPIPVPDPVVDPIPDEEPTVPETEE